MSTDNELTVTSHVARDLLAASAVFKTPEAAVWEYVVNSLQYVEPGVSPRVQVNVDAKGRRITISDNGRGMDAQGLRHFFTMHGENIERVQGRMGRGKFGTGKSAAFGIAQTLRVATRRNGKYNVAELTREVVKQSGGDEITVDWQVRNKPTDEPNGTTVVIERIQVKKIRIAPIAEYIERHLQAFRAASPQVAVNSHVCEYREPDVDAEYTFRPSPSQRGTLGDVELTVKVARGPLPEAEQGVIVTAGEGNLIAVERGGIQNKEFGNYIFGAIDVPAIEASESSIAPYDSTRSLELNPQHPIVAVLVGFIGNRLEEVRKELVARRRKAQESEQARRLQAEADKIADVLNDDFRKMRSRLQAIRSAAGQPGPTAAVFGSTASAGEEPTDWIEGTSKPGTVERTRGNGSSTNGEDREPPEVVSKGERNDEGQDTVDPAGDGGKKKKNPRGGFRVDYRNLGERASRSEYDEVNLTILINLDHPVVSAALGDGKVEDPAFRRLSYEIAFSEYAMALGYEFLKQDPNLPADDLLYEVRSSLNRVATAAADLYRVEYHA